MKNIIFTITFLAASIAFSHSQDSLTVKDKFLTIDASYIGDNVNNLSGGIKTGSCYLGLANIHLNFNTEKAGLWHGGQFYINTANTHGAMPSADLLGDIQVASNIEAGNHTFVQELLYKQTIHRLEVTIGLQDLNIEFANSEYSSLFLNSSFGILPLISGNIAAPIFPLTSIGITSKWNITDKISWINALYDGSPSDFDYNPYNLNWQFNSGDGILAISEFQLNTDFKELPGTYKIGLYSHNHIIEKNIPDSLDINVFGIYTYVDQKIWVRNNKSIGLFAQFGYSPSNSITNNLYLGIGLNYTGIFSDKSRDVLGLAFAQEHFTNGMLSETTIELSYQYQLNKTIFIQPDFQYIFHPAGTGVTLDNAVAGILRFGLNF